MAIVSAKKGIKWISCTRKYTQKIRMKMRTNKWRYTIQGTLCYNIIFFISNEKVNIYDSGANTKVIKSFNTEVLHSKTFMVD